MPIMGQNWLECPPIKTSADFYRIGKMLGKGAFGRVNLAMHKVTERLVAVKSMNKQYITQGASSLPVDGKDIPEDHTERKKLL
jgi:serine/threonine protein kinase